jgi:hypothetical protein
MQRSEFDPGPFHLRLAVDQVALGQAFPRKIYYSLDNIIPSVLHALLSLLIRWRGGLRLERCKEKYFYVYISKGWYFSAYSVLSDCICGISSNISMCWGQLRFIWSCPFRHLPGNTRNGLWNLAGWNTEWTLNEHWLPNYTECSLLLYRRTCCFYILE